jgi:hypothetical protein
MMLSFCTFMLNWLVLKVVPLMLWKASTEMRQFHGPTWATSVKLIHTLINNIYLWGFSISSKTELSITEAYSQFFLFCNVWKKSSCASHTLCIKKIFSAELANK